jgi:hypothetical protein
VVTMSGQAFRACSWEVHRVSKLSANITPRKAAAAPCVWHNKATCAAVQNVHSRHTYAHTPSYLSRFPGPISDCLSTLLCSHAPFTPNQAVIGPFQ